MLSGSSTLLQLLKRPSAISLLHDLVSTSSAAGIERLNVRTERCINCQTRRSHAKPLPCDSSSIVSGAEKNVKLQVYDIGRAKSSSRLNRRDIGRGPTEGDLPLALDVDQLEYESSFHTKKVNGRKRLVDDPERKHDFGLWKELLQYRKRRYGHRGVVEIWNGFIDRSDGIQLPVQGEPADYIWETFAEAGLVDEQLLYEFTTYAEKLWLSSRKRWSRLYQTVVGGLFTKGLPEEAISLHRRLQSIHLDGPTDIVLVMAQAVSCTPQKHPDWSLYSRETITLGNGRGVRAFGEICMATEGHQIYETVIPFLLRRGLMLDAAYMHDFLIKGGDMPRDLNTVQQVLDFANSEGHTFSQKVRQRLRKLKSSTLNTSVLESLAPSEQVGAPNNNLQEKPDRPKDQEDWIKEKTFRDEFGARLFATKALTVDMITNGLQMFGVQAIGPLSLREIALRADGPKDILEKMRALRKANITIRDCAFTRLVEKLALEHKDIVLEDLLHSDQHPDVLEDVAVQENLLCSYLLARDWRLYNLTKAVLNEVAKDDMDNIQFRVSLSAKEWSAASDVADRMYLDAKSLTQQSIDHMFYTVLTPRLPGRLQPYPEDPKFDEVSYAARILKLAFRSGTEIDPQYWVELLKRMGMHRHDQWQQVNELCLWLAHNYVVQDDSPFLHSLSRSTGTEPDAILAKNRTLIRHIFNPRMQMALIAWGFKSSLWYKNQVREIADPIGGGMVIRWTRGLLLLRDLERLGVTIYPSFVRQACRERLQMLFGELYSVRRWNRTLRQKNPFRFSRILNDMLTIYPTLFTQEDRVDLHKLIDRPLHGMASRRMREQYEWLGQWPASRHR
ncbi:conserved hypothetical protein [Talaromyces stipitatus ATCC 10500]|uniref:Uncharacterized protein n=1 Tax=Talaromyces stipitatus (strain ATCC 10500 / CBS 375.48 / QM 6759 / NRRL 1006) TaxID=441959 RepID=B8MKT7_TALSN|nr:uncharacterized protein TSTA_044030 [Talaromyces stipitatus ATCC 10500]EED14936.1 conserved hypothetical protein [Talaromyces stipitatus ATCC 10500]